MMLLSGCKDHRWNNPQTGNADANVRYSSFNAPPKTLDPARSYSEEETIIISQIYEPPLQYHYLLRPYRLIPLAAQTMPTVTYLDANQQPLSNIDGTDKKIAYTLYTIHIKPQVFYQPHPAFAKDKNGNYLYLQLPTTFNSVQKLSDFPEVGTRELTAEDYVYEIKRLASPKVNSPIYGLMSEHILGFSDYTKILNKAIQQNPNQFLDLRQYPLTGVKVLDRYTYSITLKGKYPQFIYWLAMPFFAPVPWEADEFYSQPALIKKNITFDWYPIGTGPYYLTKNNPNREMVLQKNPNFHGEAYPTEGQPEDAHNGLLTMAGKPMPFIDKYVFTLEKEFVPRWNKFLQGYYDNSTISSDSFAQAIKVDENNQPQLTSALQEKNIHLYTSIEPAINYWGFNMRDEVVGGYSERARKLRQAISIAINTEEFINIFLNGRGIAAQGPIPPGIFGYQNGANGIDPYVYEWRNDRAQRKSIAIAKQLLAEAGYPDGRDAKTGKPLILNYDVPATGGPDDKAIFDWMREQFDKLGIQLNIRATQYNRFQEKMATGNAQIYLWGWNADYPDPENFLFLFYGPNGKAKFGGENASNYENPEYDRLFEQMRNLPNGPEREQVITKMIAILNQDAPWVWGFNYKNFILSQAWNGPIKPDALGNNLFKYMWLDPQLRAQKQSEWNKPVYWPLILIFIFLILALSPIFIKYWQQQNKPRIKKVNI